MANTSPYVGNIISHDPHPLIVPGKFAAGSSQAVERGDILELTGSTNTEWVPIDSDFAGDANIAVSAVEIQSGDLAGYYGIIVPRPGDVFEFEYASATNPSLGDSVYYSAAQKVASSGSNAIGYVCGWGHYPYPQGFKAINGAAAPDQGTTIKTISKVRIAFLPAVSYYEALFGPLA